MGLTPTVRQKAQAIVDEVWQQEGCLNASAIKDLTYIEAIVKETMRLYPVGIPGKQPLHLGFSLGPHYCVGAPLALLEATIMLSALLHYFDWELVNGSASLEQFDQNLTIFPRDRMPVRFQVRSFVRPQAKSLVNG